MAQARSGPSRTIRPSAASARTPSGGQPAAAAASSSGGGAATDSAASNRSIDGNELPGQRGPASWIPKCFAAACERAPCNQVVEHGAGDGRGKVGVPALHRREGAQAPEEQASRAGQRKPGAHRGVAVMGRHGIDGSGRERRKHVVGQREASADGERAVQVQPRRLDLRVIPRIHGGRKPIQPVPGQATA